MSGCVSPRTHAPTSFRQRRRFYFHRRRRGGPPRLHSARGRPSPRRRNGAQRMDPKSTAVVLIEYQNDFTSDGGALHAAVKPVMQSTGMLGHTVATVRKARELGAQIVFAPISFAPDYHELSAKPYGILAGVVASKAFRKGTWGAEMVEMLTPEPQDIVIEGK